MGLRKPLIIANWKMNLGVQSSVVLVEKFLQAKTDYKNVELVMCPAFTALTAVAQALVDSAVVLGAQDLFWEDTGAFTGEVSAEMLKEVGCHYVIVGHSERRLNLKESDTMVHQKVRAALQSGLTPIICVGESFDERSEGHTEYVIIQQVTAALSGISLLANEEIVIAYEPIWVIGSGQAVEPSEAERIIKVIRHLLLDFYPREVVEKSCRVIYGGSVNEKNISVFVKASVGDGVLVGSASLHADELVKLIKGV